MTEEENMAEQVSPAEVFPPGDFLGEELEARGWSQQEFAEIIGRPANAVSEIINGKRAITPATAKELATALGTSAMLWLNLEAEYRLHQTAEAPESIGVKARIRSRYPLRDMIQRGWIEPSDNPDVLEHRVLRFFNVDSIDEDPVLPLAARKGMTGSQESDESTPKQWAWLFRVKQCAEAMQISAKYSEATLRERMIDLEALMLEPEGARQVPRLLEECGVRFVVVEPLPGSKIDGVCFWLNAWSPVVGLSLRLDRIDNFWFVLRHELEHVLSRDAAVDSNLTPGAEAIDESERAANEAAAMFGVTVEDLESFVMRVQPLFSETRILGFARRHGVHPGIVVGRLQYRLNRYDLLRRHLANIREHVTATALTDGYGRVCPV